MGDFYQNGLVTTLHNLRSVTLEQLETRLIEYSRKRPMALVIPSLYSELDGSALPHILEELEKIPYLNEIVIGLDAANEEQFRHARECFSRLPQHHRVLWHDGPRLRAIDAKLKEKGVAPNAMGKGRNVWYCFGYLIASDKSEAIALHDADIITYDRSLLARLFYPVVDPTFRYRFCKGYYYRADENKLNGRVSRLLVTPLLRALKKMLGSIEYLDYLDSFRYPLAGEFSMRADVVKTIRIPSDWGLEVGVLGEVHRNNSTNRICQVEIWDRYDHKHQEVSYDSVDKGISKMSLDIARAIYGKLAANGTIFSQEMFRTIKATYFRIALDFVEQYHSDAVINGFTLDRHAEEDIVGLFAQNIYRAGEDFLENPMQINYIPSWKRVISAFPEISKEFYEAVELDNQ